MKILVLSAKSPWPPHDGGAIATLRCIKGLMENGASVSLMTMRTQKQTSPTLTDDQVISSLNYYKTVNIDTTIKPLDLFTNFIFSKEPYDLIRFRKRKFTEGLKTLLQRDSYDIIQCEGLVFSYYLEDIRSSTSAPVVLRAHNVEHRIREMLAQRTEKKIKKVYLKNLADRIREREIWAANQFDAVVPITKSDMEWFSDVAPGRPMLMMGTGVDELTNPANVNINEQRVGFIGALDWQPNIDGLLWFLKEVWPYISKRMPSASLHIAGRNASEKVQKNLVGKNVVYEGEVRDSHIFTAAMSVMIAPLFAGSGMRIKIIEAMSLGKVTVATPVAAEGLPVTHRKDILIAEDKYMFSTAVIEVLSRPELRNEISTAACALIKKRFGNRELTSDLVGFYKTLIHDS